MTPRLRSALVGAVFALLVAAAAPTFAQQPAPAPRGTAPAAGPQPSFTPVPIPSPLTSLPPASQPTTLPYPAYGTPAPGIGRGVPVPQAPTVVSLEQAIAVGFARSPLLAQARAAVEIATAPVQLARTGLFPDISAGASSSHTDEQPGTSSTCSSGTPCSITANALDVTLTQLIYDGGHIAAELHAAQANQVVSLADYKRELQTVAYNVSNAYYAALAAQRTTQVDLATVQLDEVDEALVAAELRAGTASQVDLATAELPVAQARVAVVQAQGAELSAQATFVNAMGLDANALVLPQDDGNVLSGTSYTPEVQIPTYDQAVQRALMLRPDYYAAVQTVESDRASLRAAKLNDFPHLDGTATHDLGSTDEVGGNYRNATTVGLDLTIPIYDQGVTAAEVAQAQGTLDQGQALLQDTKLGIQLNVKQALVSLVSARAAFIQTSTALSEAEEVLHATQAQYQAGVTTLPLLLNAQVSLTQALTSQVTALYTVRQAEAAFLYAEGDNTPM